MENIYEILTMCAPLIAGVFTSIIIPAIISRFSKKYLAKKIDEINESDELRFIKKELYLIKKEILEMRGKTND